MYCPGFEEAPNRRDDLILAAALVSVRENGSISTAMSYLGTNGIIFHIVAYGVTNLAAFMSLIAVYKHTGRDDITGLVACRKDNHS